MTCILISTAHLREGLWFKDDEDYRTGMNYVAIVAYTLGIPVLAFVLMSNHTHFVLACSEGQARAFIFEYKRLYSFYYRHKYQVKEFLKNNECDFRSLSKEDESLERAIAYVQMNPVAANVCMHATQYPWGTGSSFFNLNATAGEPLGNHSFRKQKLLLHSKVRLPQDYRLLNGCILPESYVKTKWVETLYRTPKRMNYFLVNSSKAKARIENKEFHLPSFRDLSLSGALSDLCRSLFNRQQVEGLEPEQQAEVIRQLRFRFGADIVQIARVSGIPYSEISRILDSY